MDQPGLGNGDGPIGFVVLAQALNINAVAKTKLLSNHGANRKVNQQTLFVCFASNTSVAGKSRNATKKENAKTQQGSTHHSVDRAVRK